MCVVVRCVVVPWCWCPAASQAGLQLGAVPSSDAARCASRRRAGRLPRAPQEGAGTQTEAPHPPPPSRAAACGVAALPSEFSYPPQDFPTTQIFPVASRP